MYVFKKNTLLPINDHHHLSLQQTNFFTGGGSCLEGDGCRLLRMVVAEGWGACDPLLK